MLAAYTERFRLGVDAEVVEYRNGMCERGHASAMPCELRLPYDGARRVGHGADVCDTAVKRRIRRRLVFLLVCLLPRFVFACVNMHVAKSGKDETLVAELVVNLLLLRRGHHTRNEPRLLIDGDNAPIGLFLVGRNASSNCRHKHAESYRPC